MKNFIKIASLLVCAAGSSAAMALPISGEITFIGDSEVVDGTINFTDVEVRQVSESFIEHGVERRDAVAFTGFNYEADPFEAVPALWSVGVFTFKLRTLTVDEPVGGADLSMFGTGTLIHDGGDYRDVAYNWEYSGNTFRASTTQTFSSSASPSASVPEPGSLALVGLGLVGFAVAGYGRRRTQA